VTALDCDRGAAVFEVEVLDVEVQHRASPGGGLVEHPPQGPFAQRDVPAGADPVDLGTVDGQGVVIGFVAALAARRNRGGSPSGLGAAPTEPRADRSAVAVPGRRRRRVPEAVEGVFDLDVVDGGEVAVGAQDVADAVEDVLVGPLVPSRRSDVRGG
jgi:hypothetical protein